MSKNDHESSGTVENPPLLTKSDVARPANCGARVINYWMSRGELPFVRLSARMIRFLPHDVEAFLRSLRIGGEKS